MPVGTLHIVGKAVTEEIHKIISLFSQNLVRNQSGGGAVDCEKYYVIMRLK